MVVGTRIVGNWEADRSAYIQYAEREARIHWIMEYVNIPSEAAYDLYDRMKQEITSWVEIIPYPFEHIWEPAWQRATTLMSFGEWKFDVWKDHVAQIVMYSRGVEDWLFHFEWTEIQLIEF